MCRAWRLDQTRLLRTIFDIALHSMVETTNVTATYQIVQQIGEKPCKDYMKNLLIESRLALECSYIPYEPSSLPCSLAQPQEYNSRSKKITLPSISPPHFSATTARLCFATTFFPDKSAGTRSRSSCGWIAAMISSVAYS